MKKSALRISAVSYINAKPFVYGIEHSGLLKDYTLSLDIPSICAAKLKNDQADIGLAPVTVLSELKDYFIIPDFCIGSNGPVHTVMLYSEVPLKKIKTIYLDYQSKTSSQLIQILAKHWWKISPIFAQTVNGYENKIKKTSAGLIIGDRNFSLSGKFKYVYDLSEEWKLFTGLPFVFACWIANKELKESITSVFYKALKFGVENKNAVVKDVKNHHEKIIKNYLNRCINYNFDENKQTAMNLFLGLCNTII